MERSILLNLLSKQNGMDKKNCLLSTIAFISAPTLIHNKPSSLTSFTKAGRNLYSAWDRWKDEIATTLGIEYFELKRTSERILVLFYKTELIRETLANHQNQVFLNCYGYEALPVKESLARLKSRMHNTFPHEIGIFLGYPIEDVVGFVENHGKEYLLCRYWKVYHNPERAKGLFEVYDRARIQIINAINSADDCLGLKLA